MAIDSRISLEQKPLNIGQRFGQNIQNLQQVDLLNQRRDIAPLQLEQAQRANDLGIAQQPALLQEAERASSGQTQALLNQQQINELDLSSAKSLSPILASGNPQAVIAKLNEQKANAVKFNLVDDIAEIDQAIQLAQTSEGIQQLKQITDNFLTQGKPVGIQSTQFIPGKGFATISKTGEAQLVPVEGVGETTEQKRKADIEGRASTEQLKASLSGKSSAIKAAVGKGAKAFDKIQTLSTAISNYDEAIAAIDSGAETGVIDSLLPSFRQASIELDNVVKRLGLDVVGNTTFGALSESELKFALAAAIPTGLQPAELKEWLIAKRDAQKKVKERVEEAASFLSTGTHTLTDWIEFDKARQLNFANKQNQQATPDQSTPAQTQQIGRFTVEVVN
jgi:hypothetical protein